jgi:hypothetical protein
MENPKQPIHRQNSALSATLDRYDLQNSPADLVTQYMAALSGLVNRHQAHHRPLNTNDIWSHSRFKSNIRQTSPERGSLKSLDP